MDEEFIQVRVRRPNADRLKRYAARMRVAVDKGRIKAELHPSFGVTADAAIAHLLDLEERHHQRSLKSKKKS